MKEIKLSQNKVTQVDDSDFEYLSQFKWFAVNYHNHFYACTEIKAKQCLMHRMILKACKGQIIDHADGNGLNNQRKNIRFCNHSQNAVNRIKRSGRYKYLGIWHSDNRIRAGVRVNGKLINLGSFKSEIEAAIAYDQAALKYFGEFANPNFKD